MPDLSNHTPTPDNSPGGENGALVTADVLCIGGGMIGLTLAWTLGQAGLRVAVIERQAQETQIEPAFDGRASAIAFASQRLLDSTGLWPAMADHAQPIWQIRVSDGPSLGFLHFDHNALGDGPFGYMLENRHIRQALHAGPDGSGNVRIFAPERVAHLERNAAGVRAVAASGREFRAQIVVAADGRSSPVREGAGIHCLRWSYGQTGIVTTVTHARDHQGVAQERFFAAGPFAILPLTGRRSSLVWTESTGSAEALLRLSMPDFEAELGRRFGGYLGALEIEGPRWHYPLELHHAETYVAPRLALIGDAAHGIHPIAGQGLNMGLRDVAALAEVLVDAHRLGVDIGAPHILERYQRWRRFDNVTLMIVTDALNRLFSNDLAPLRLARDIGLAAVNRLDPLKKFFMRHARGTVGNLPRLLRGEPL